MPAVCKAICYFRKTAKEGKGSNPNIGILSTDVHAILLLYSSKNSWYRVYVSNEQSRPEVLCHLGSSCCICGSHAHLQQYSSLLVHAAFLDFQCCSTYRAPRRTVCISLILCHHRLFYIVADIESNFVLHDWSTRIQPLNIDGLSE